jgi:hypothetical protein
VDDALNPLKLPDSRLSAALGTRHRKEKPSPIGMIEEVFCANCGTSGGGVLKTWSPFVFYLCEVCAETHGKLDLQQIPDEVVRDGKPLIS